MTSQSQAKISSTLHSSTLEKSQIANSQVPPVFSSPTINQNTDPGRSSTKRKWSVTITGLPKKQDVKKFKKLLDSADISYVHVKKIYGTSQAKVVFENSESREAAKRKFQELNLNVNEETDDTPHSSTTSLSSPSSSTTHTRNILDVVTPWHTLSYEIQLERKTAHMHRILQNITQSIRSASFYNIPTWINNKSHGDMCCPFEGVKSSPVQTGYRNKVEYTIGYTSQGQVMIGFLLGRVEEGYTAVADPSQCSNVSPLAEQVRQLFLRYIIQRYNEEKLEPYNKLLQRGFWRLLTVRTTLKYEAMAILQYNPTGFSEEQLTTEHTKLKTYLEEQKARSLGLISVYTQRHSGVSNAAPPDQPCDHLWGDTHLHETLLGVHFRISPKSFFQVNTRATEVLYTHIRQLIARYQPIDHSLTVLDIYSGIGTIGLTLARDVKQVIGIEVVADAVQDALHNSQLNGIRNVKFIVGKAEDVLQRTLQHDIRGKCVAIVDPPRAGLHTKIIRAIRACPLIEHLVYVSCNQQSLVNDSAHLCRSPSSSMPGTPFIPVTALAVDLFPSTEHCEALMLFQRYNFDNRTNDLDSSQNTNQPSSN